MSLVVPLSLVMRTRLLCGLYNRRAVRPRLRPLAQAYCLSILLLFGHFMYHHNSTMKKWMLFHWSCSFAQFLLAFIVSLWTGDEYIYKFFTQNKLTDVTLDSPMLFNRLQIRIKKSYIAVAVFYSVIFCLCAVNWYHLGLFKFITYVIPFPFFDFTVTCSCSTKLLIMALFNNRLLVLKRRLQRHGFRSVGRAKPLLYSLIYQEILRGLDATEKPLKVLLFFDVIFSCGRMLNPIITVLNGFLGQGLGEYELDLEMILFVLRTLNYIYEGFSYIVMLESAAVHCEDMTVFTATQLIKIPTTEERRRMHQFLGALEVRGARYHVMRAMPLDARFLMQALGFCFSQVIILFNTVNY